MKLNEKLRELRLAQKLTQEQVADYLGVTSQSVSKWERGILSPDIHMLPRISTLFKTSIDSLFDMTLYWGEQHEMDFRAQVRALWEKGDKNGVWNVYMAEIDLCPDRFDYYTEIMLYSYRSGFFDDEHISRLVRLADYADEHCRDDDKRNEIHRIMLQLCGSSENPDYKEIAKRYYKKLPSMRHSRETYAGFVLSGEDYENQLKKNIMHSVDIAECAVRQMLAGDMPHEEKLYLYMRAAALYEAVSDGGFMGFFDLPLMNDYTKIAELLLAMGRKGEADAYIAKILEMLEKFVMPEKQKPTAPFITETHPKGFNSTDKNCTDLIRGCLKREVFAEHKEKLLKILQLLEAKTDEKTKI